MDDSQQENISQPPGSPIPDSPVPEPPADEGVQSPSDDWTVETVIAALDRDYKGELPEEAIRAAQERRDEIIPHLIKLVERATALARDGELSTSDGQIVALFLLTEFQAQEALSAILDAMTLSGDDLYELYGEAIDEDFCRVLAVLAADSPEQVDALIASDSIDKSVMWAAAETYLLWVRDGRLTREQAVEKLRQHLRGAIADQDFELASMLVHELESYVSRAALPEIEEAFRQELVDEFMITREEIEATLAEGDASWQATLNACPPTAVEDTFDELQDWYCFQGVPDDEFDEYPFAEEDEDDEYQEDFARAFREKMGLPPSLLDEPSMLEDDEFRNLWNAARSQEFPETHSEIHADTNSETIRRTEPRVGRNEPCPCGSGKKFKKCCGKN